MLMSVNTFHFTGEINVVSWIFTFTLKRASCVIVYCTRFSANSMNLIVYVDMLLFFYFPVTYTQI